MFGQMRSRRVIISPCPCPCNESCRCHVSRKGLSYLEKKVIFWFLFLFVLEAYANETGGLSFLKKDNINFQAVLTYGNIAIPILLQNIDEYGWCVIALLGEITKQRPFPKEYAGNYNKIANAWKNWGKENGYL